MDLAAVSNVGPDERDNARSSCDGYDLWTPASGFSWRIRTFGSSWRVPKERPWCPKVASRLIVTGSVLLLAASPLVAQAEDYEIHGGFRVGRYQVGVPATRMVLLLGSEEASGPWRASWGQGRALYWPRRGVNAKVCGSGDVVVEVNVYIPPLPAGTLDDLLVEIGRYQINRQIGIRTPSFLLPEYFGEPDERRVVPSLLGATRLAMYWFPLGLHVEAEFGEVVEIGVVVIPPRCP